MLKPKLAYELSDIEFREQSAEYFDGLTWFFKALKFKALSCSTAQESSWVCKGFFENLIEVERSLAIRLSEYERMVKACASYSAKSLGDKGMTYDLSEPEEGRAVDIDMLKTTDDISDIDLDDLKCLMEDDASPLRDNQAKKTSEDT